MGGFRVEHDKGEIHCVEAVEYTKERMCFVRSYFRNGEGDIVFCGVDFIDVAVLRGKALICTGSFDGDVCDGVKVMGGN